MKYAERTYESLKNKIIAIDGPAGSGKSTIAKELSKTLKYTYIDTGAMYRALTLKVIKENINIENIDLIVQIAKKTDINFLNNAIHLDGENVNNEIRLEEINQKVSLIAAIKDIRNIMVDQQRKIANNSNVVMDGRDIGTVVFPQAFAKFYLTATPEVRANRRYSEMVLNNCKITFDEVLQSIIKRDNLDENREVSPLKPADDAVVIDTSNKSIDEVISQILKIIKTKGEEYAL